MRHVSLSTPAKASYQTYRIDDDNEGRVVVDATGDPEATWDDFLAILPPDDALWATVHFDYETDG